MDKKVQNTYTLLARALLMYLCSQACCQQCVKPCQCPGPVPACPDGVNLVLDGCGCCQVCARQKGETCTDILVCDTQHGLECDYSASVPGSPGECVSQEDLGCEMNGVSYRDGEVFQPSCTTQCKCAGGGVTCVPLCHEDVRLPSSDCPNPQRFQLPGKCCKEWVCDMDNSVLQDAQTASGESQVLPALPGYLVSSRVNCIHQSTEWSACSKTCGPGISTRVSNQNAVCRLEQQIRHCRIRPCLAASYQTQVWPRTCQPSYRSNIPKHLFYQGCYSTQVFRTRYCGYCTDGRCCTPYQTDTDTVTFQCPGGHQLNQLVMMIRSCVCHYNCPDSSGRIYRKLALLG